VLLSRPPKWITSYYSFLLSILFISELFVGVVPAHVQPQAALARKNVLVLYS